MTELDRLEEVKVVTRFPLVNQRKDHYRLAAHRSLASAHTNPRLAAHRSLAAVGPLGGRRGVSSNAFRESMGCLSPAARIGGERECFRPERSRQA